MFNNFFFLVYQKDNEEILVQKYNSKVLVLTRRTKDLTSEDKDYPSIWYWKSDNNNYPIHYLDKPIQDTDIYALKPKEFKNKNRSEKLDELLYTLKIAYFKVKNKLNIISKDQKIELADYDKTNSNLVFIPFYKLKTIGKKVYYKGAWINYNVVDPTKQMELEIDNTDKKNILNEKSNFKEKSLISSYYDSVSTFFKDAIFVNWKVKNPEKKVVINKRELVENPFYFPYYNPLLIIINKEKLYEYTDSNLNANKSNEINRSKLPFYYLALVNPGQNIHLRLVDYTIKYKKNISEKELNKLVRDKYINYFVYNNRLNIIMFTIIIKLMLLI